MIEVLGGISIGVFVGYCIGILAGNSTIKEADEIIHQCRKELDEIKKKSYKKQWQAIDREVYLMNEVDRLEGCVGYYRDLEYRRKIRRKLMNGGKK